MIIYLFTNTINGKRYVGQTTQPIEKRYWQHENDAMVKKLPYPLHCAIRKYGMHNFKMKILSRCWSMEEMNHREGYYIKLFNTIVGNKKGYNVLLGGSNSKRSDETKKKMSIAFTGRVKSPEERLKMSLRNKGKKLSEQHKEKLRISSTGKTQSPEARKKVSDSKIGKPRSEATKQKVREANLGKKYGEETIKKLRLCRKNLVPVTCVETGTTYPSMNEAARQTGLGLDQIIRSVNGKKIKSCFTFKKVK